MSRRAALAVLVVAVALLARIAFFQQWKTNPFLESPVLDARGYVQWAEEILSGQPIWHELRIHGPGYPFFLAAVLAVTGHDLAAATFVNSLLGCGWILLLVLAVRRLFPPPTAEVTGLLAAVYWPFLHFEGHLLATTWFTFLLVAAFFLLTRALTGRRSARTLFVAGLALGWATITRPNGAAPVPFVLALLLLPGTPPVTRTTRVRGALGLAAGFALLVTPVLVRNAQLGGGLVLQDHAMFNAYLGNSAESPGYAYVRPGIAWDRLADAPRREAGLTTPAEKSAWFRDRLLEHARRDPLSFARLQGRKLVLFWNEREIRATLSPHFFERYAPLQGVLPGFGLVGPFALVGLFLAARGTRRPGLLCAFALPSAALVIATVVGGRYRLPVVPFLLPFAGWTIVRMAGWARARDVRPLGISAAALAGAFAVVHHDFPDLHETWGEESARVATVLQQRGDLPEAAEWWERSLRDDPERVESYVSYAALGLTTGDAPLVERVTRQGLQVTPDHPLLLMMRGRALLLLGRPEESLAALRPVLRQRPQDADLLLGIARAHFDAGHPDSSLHWFRKAMAAAPDRTDIREDATLVLREIERRSSPPPTGQ